MKKTILTFVFAVAAMVGMAQNMTEKTDKQDTVNRVNADIHLGVNYSSISFPDVGLNANGQAGWYGGVSLQYNISDWLGVKLGCDYSLNRSYVPDPADVFGNRLNYQQSSVVVPLTLQLGYNGAKEHFTIGIGGYVNYNFNQSGAFTTLGDKKNFGGGVQYSLNMGFEHFYYEMVLRADLSELGFHTPGVSGTYPSARLFSCMFGIGYRL